MHKLAHPPDVVNQLFAEPPDGGNHHAVVRQLNVAYRRLRGFTAIKRVLDTCEQQPVFNGVQSFWAFGVTCAHFMFAAVFVCEISGSVHGVNIFG